MSVLILIPKKGNAKECSNYCASPLVFKASKVMLKIFQARLQQYVNWELTVVQVGRKGRGIRDQISNILWIIEKAREFQKNMYFYFIDYVDFIMAKYIMLSVLHILEVILYIRYSSCLWLCGLQQTVENSSRDGNTWPPYLPPEKSVYRSRSKS